MGRWRPGCRGHSRDPRSSAAPWAGAACAGTSSRRRTTHVVDPLPKRVRLVDAPGSLRDRELEVLSWTTDSDQTALICRLPDGTAGRLPARWTDLPRRIEPKTVVGGIGSPAGWRLLLARAGELRGRRPVRGRVSGENGGARVRTAGVGDWLRSGGGRGGVGDAAGEEATGSDVATGAPFGADGGGRAR
jgi:hypothetical protein